MIPALVNGGAALAATGWSSSSSPAFDFRSNGSATPMYLLFALAAAVFLAGIVRLHRRIGSNDSGGPARGAGSLARLLLHVLVQPRLHRRQAVAWAHLPIFWGVVVLALGSLTIMIDGSVLQPLGHELQRGLAYRVFQASLDFFGVAFVAGIALAIWRRMKIRPSRKPADPAMLGFLWILLAVGISGFVLEGLRIRLEGVSEPWAFGGMAVASMISWVSPSPDTGTVAYSILWWGHVIVAFGLFAAVPYTGLRHLLTAPLHIAAAREHPDGVWTTPFKLSELIKSGNFDVRVGAKSADDFSRGERLGFTACVDSGFCEIVCPAHETGTALSPKTLVGSLRSAVDAGSNGEDVLSEEAIWSCTLCGACAQACPTLVDPMAAVTQLRRGLVSQNRLGAERTKLLGNLTRGSNPYGSNTGVRSEVREALGVRGEDAEWLYWVGCAATFDGRARKVAQATARILDRAGIRYDVLGADEFCCGDPARRIGEEGLFQDLVARNIEAIERRGVGKILTHCAHCFHTLRHEYPEFGARFEVVHHGELIDRLIRTGKIETAGGEPESLTFHDACYVGRLNREFEAPRSILASIPGARLQEMERSRERSFCCGAGGGNYWYQVPRRETAASARMREASATNSTCVVTECPYCLKMLEDGGGGMPVRDIAEIVAASLVEG